MPNIRVLVELCFTIEAETPDDAIQIIAEKLAGDQHRPAKTTATSSPTGTGPNTSSRPLRGPFLFAQARGFIRKCHRHSLPASRAGRTGLRGRYTSRRNLSLFGRRNLMERPGSPENERPGMSM